MEFVTPANIAITGAGSQLTGFNALTSVNLAISGASTVSITEAGTGRIVAQKVATGADQWDFVPRSPIWARTDCAFMIVSTGSNITGGLGGMLTAPLPVPLQLSDLSGWADFADVSSLWKDTARTSPVTVDGDIIKGVTDKSGAGFHWAEATNGPTFKAAIQNARSVARFDGTNDTLQMTPASPAPGTARTIVCVVRKVTPPGAPTATVLTPANSDLGQLHVTSGTHATGYNWFATQVGGTQVNVGNVSVTSWNIMVLRINSAASLDIYGNGGTATNFDPDDAVTSAGVRLFMGSGSAASNFGDYDYGEMLYYMRALTTAELNRLGPSLATKWGLTWTTAT